MEGPGTINPNEFTQCEINQLLWLLELGEPPNSPPNTIGICFNIVRQPVTPFFPLASDFPTGMSIELGSPTTFKSLPVLVHVKSCYPLVISYSYAMAHKNWLVVDLPL